MNKHPDPPQAAANEARRLAALHLYDILDTPPEQALDDLVAVAAQICGTPVAQINLVDRERQWTKASVGTESPEVPRALSFCAQTIQQQEALVVENTTKDPRFADNPFVTGEPGVRFYAAMPLITPEGEGLGSLCVVDTLARVMTPAQKQALSVLGRQVMTHLELRRRVRDLGRRERLLTAIFEAEPECATLLAADGAVRLINPTGLAVFEADSTGQMDSHSIASLVVPEHRAAFADLMERVLRGGSGRLEFRIVALKGAERWLAIHAVPLRDEGDETTEVLGMIRDVTQHKRAEARLRRLIDSNVQGVFFWNRAGTIKGGNDAFLKTIGYTREELEAGQIDWRLITPPECAERDELALRDVLQKGSCETYEKEYIRKNGTRVPVLVGSATFEDDPDEGLGFVFDLTERKQLEQQFLRSQRMEGIGTLAGGVAHDLNNALSPILMSLDILKDRLEDDDSRELLEIIGTCARRGADMVRQLLSFARGVEGQKMDVQIKQILTDIEQMARETFPKNILVRSSITPGLGVVLGDPTQLHQVFLNLCVNARDAMPDGGTLAISAEPLVLDDHFAGLEAEAKPGPYVSIRVEDSGLGMPPEVIAKIFDPFFTTKELGKGTGLGLSTSLGIVKSHRGFVRVYSEPGKGTTFNVYLPVRAGGPAGPVAAQAAGAPDGRGELILVVDDEAAVRRITKQMLEAHGYRVVVAEDGTEAIKIFAAQHPGIAAVLTDMMMPLMDGPTTIQILRKIVPDVRVIASSGLSDSEHVAQATRMGIECFLPKPYTADALLKTLRQVLDAAEPPAGKSR